MSIHSHSPQGTPNSPKSTLKRSRNALNDTTEYTHPHVPANKKQRTLDTHSDNHQQDDDDDTTMAHEHSPDAYSAHSGYLPDNPSNNLLDPNYTANSWN